MCCYHKQSDVATWRAQAALAFAGASIGWLWRDAARSGATSLPPVQALEIHRVHDIDLTYPVPQMTFDEALEAAFAQRPDLRKKIVQTLSASITLAKVTLLTGGSSS